MILSGKEILKKIGTEIIIEPFSETQINPNSYNLKLHNELMIYTDEVLDMKQHNKTERIVIPDNGYVLKPGKVYLARTHEYVRSDYYVPMLEGRSSTGRLGLFIHVSAGFGNIGSAGNWTLELVVAQPLRIYAGIQICQIYFQNISQDYHRYENKYKGSTDIQESYLYKELENKKKA